MGNILTNTGTNAVTLWVGASENDTFLESCESLCSSRVELSFHGITLAYLRSISEHAQLQLNELVQQSMGNSVANIC